MRAHLDQVPGDELLVLARGERELAGGVEGEGRHARAVLVQSLLHLPRPHLHNTDNNIRINFQNTRKILIERKKNAIHDLCENNFLFAHDFTNRYGFPATLPLRSDRPEKCGSGWCDS